jgi:hypothetical protein
MNALSKRLLILSLGVALSGCGEAGDAGKKQASQGKQAANDNTLVTTATIGAGKYVASIDGMT